MEGVEDIPETVLSEGIDFCWETFPEYLNALESSSRIMDIGTQVPHSALRFFVKGDDGANHLCKPNEEQISKMKSILEEALCAGALGISTSRTTKHKSADGNLVPSLNADDKELAGIAEALKNTKKGLLQCNSDMGPGEMESGNKLVVSGTSSRGTKTEDIYSLFGFTASLKLIDKALKLVQLF